MSVVRVSRLLITGFRGFRHLDLYPRDSVLLAGVARAGRTDIITALIRVLDPDASRGPFITDLHQYVPPEDPDDEQVESDTSTSAAPALHASVSALRSQIVRVPSANIEVTLTDLDPGVQQLFDQYLEPLDPSGRVSEDVDADEAAPLCVRIAYRLTYDIEAETLDSVYYFPFGSDPAIGQYARVPAATRRALPVLTLNTGQPMQLRAGGNLRRAVDERNPKAATAAFETLADAITDAVTEFSTDPAVAEAITAILAVGGTGGRLGDQPLTAAEVGFLTEDGTLAALLRTLRATLSLDSAGPLALANHGSTATAVLATAEALLHAKVPGAIVLADDFDDQLDATAAEHLAALVRSRAGQAWVSTRRPEAARAFEPSELVRLVRHGGSREHHQIAKITDRKKLTAMRQLHTQLLPALTAPTIVITEGPHDIAVLSMVDRRSPSAELPLSAHGVRLVAAGTGQDGGIDEIPRVASLAKQLGFRVLAVIDRDRDSAQTSGQLAKIQAECDVVIRLPEAIEQAILRGVGLAHVEAASTVLPDYDLPNPLAGPITDLEAALSALCKVIHKKGVHEQILDALYAEKPQDKPDFCPPVLAETLTAIARAAHTAYDGPTLIDIPMPARPQVIGAARSTGPA